MKKLILTSILIVLAAAGTTIMGQDRNESYLGLPGDNLNLFAVMKLFQESQTLEEFERNLNDQNSRINNLDLNGDNLVDYIRVIDNAENNVHYIVLQVSVSAWENQDVAVFTVQRFANGNVQLQLVGDEDLYGKSYIVEPYYDTSGETPNPGYAGNSRYVNEQPSAVITTTYYEISAWPIIRFIYLPDYVVWHSSWYWGFWPEYWHPWRPYYWHYYYGYHYNWNSWYYGHYRHWHTYRDHGWNDHYCMNRRVSSPVVRARIHEGNYKVTYSRPESRREGEELYRKESRGRVNSHTADNRGTGQERRAEPNRKQSDPDNYGIVNRRTASRDENFAYANPSQKDKEKAENRRNENVVTYASRGSSSHVNSNTENRRKETIVTDKPRSNVSHGNSNTLTRHTVTRYLNSVAEKKPQERRSETTKPVTQSKERSLSVQGKSENKGSKSTSSQRTDKSSEKTGRR